MDATFAPVSNLLILGILVLIGWHSVSLMRRGRWLALDPLNTFWGGVLIVYVVQPVRFGNVFQSWHPPGVMEWTLGWSLLGFGLVVLGYEARWGVQWGRAMPALPGRLRPGRLAFTAGGFIILGVLGYLYLISTATSFWEWISVPRGGTNWRVVNSYIASLTNFLPFGVFMLLFLISFFRVEFWLTLVVWGLVVSLALWQVYLGSRHHLIGTFLGTLAAYYLPKRQNPPVWLLAGGFLALMTLVTFMGLYREYFSNLNFNFDQIDFEEAGRKVLPDFLGGESGNKGRVAHRGIEFNCVMSVVDLTPDSIDFNYGYCFLEFLTRPIPRVIWPDKLYPHYEAFTPIYHQAGLTDQVVPTSKELLLTGPAFTFVGYWYAIGGPVALCAAGFLTGCFLRLLRTIYDRSPGNQGNTLFYYVLLPIGFGEAAATPLFWVFNYVFVLGAMATILYFCRESPLRPMMYTSVGRQPFGRINRAIQQVS